MTKARPGWRKIAALPSIKQHSLFVEEVLCTYIDDWYQCGNEHDSLKTTIGYYLVGDERPPVCPQTLMKLFVAITGLETQRGHNEFTKRQLFNARERMRAFWEWHADRGQR